MSQVGAIPVPVDPQNGQHLIDAPSVEAAVTARTRAVVPVHLYGDPVDLEPLLEVAHRHGLRVIEDAAQAHGATYRGRRIGSHGDLVAWSFYPGKNLGAAGDAGAVTTNHSELADRVRLLGNYGAREKYSHDEQGVNSRLDPLQAAVLRVKLRHLDEWNTRRRAIANNYRSSLPEQFLLSTPATAEPVHHLMAIRVQDRARVRNALDAVGIETGVHYPTPPHLQRAYAALAHEANWSLPAAEALADTVMSLPIGPHLAPEQVAFVLEHLIPALDA